MFVTSSVLTKITNPYDSSCSYNEFECGDGGCVSIDRVCNGIEDCSGAEDETVCYEIPAKFGLHSSRRRRQTSNCKKSEWRCRDGTCISFDGKCDGVVDCPDSSDETHALCGKTTCQSNWFRCTYGACVDGTAPCNGIQECADNSDELLPQCRGNEVADATNLRDKFKCADGNVIPATAFCDGVADCPDGSDETVQACAGRTCPAYLFQCAYGACVDAGSDCNGIKECADGSDESDELCDRVLSGKPTQKPSASGGCVLPQYPAHGSYVVLNTPNATPGQTFDSIQVNVTCKPGYGVMGRNDVFCLNGWWSDKLPQCVRFCTLNSHASVEYKCLLTNGNEGTRPCGSLEPTGTIVQPQCRSPNYYSTVPLGYMRCIEGNWDYVATCTPECGRVTPDGEELVFGGRSAKRGELPWHAGIYRKTSTPYMQICGGSLVSTTVVISAAHCFWSNLNQQLPTTDYAVAVGKIYRPWNNPKDLDVQKSDVRDIKIPIRFQGRTANFQEDIAIVILATRIEYRTYVRPACLDFDISFERQQLQDGKPGKVAGWGLTSENGNASQILKVVDLPYIDIDRCIGMAPPGFREYINGDKICAGDGEGKALCKGDSGGGLAFSTYDKGVERYYLRGIVSTASTNENLCNTNTFTTFTQVSKHEHFIKQYLHVVQT